MKRLLLIILGAGVLATSIIAVAGVGQPSKNVVIIGGSTLQNSYPCVYTGSTNANVNYGPGSGCFTVGSTTGHAEFTAFTFAAMLPSAVTTSSLAAYDTAFLNVASYAIGCNTNNINATAKAALFDFVKNGGKLIIYDGECRTAYYTPNPYAWLNDLSFLTSNPGAMGASGTLNVVEDSALGTAKPDATYGTPTQYRSCTIPVADPDNAFLTTYCINVANLSTGTDAVGDANVMTTENPWWNGNMVATNYLGKTGPVHTYALLGQDGSGNPVYGADQGMVIYNGLDYDYNSNANLIKLWYQELAIPFNPSGLKGSVPLIGIALAPLNVSKFTGKPVTLTATLTDQLANPQAGVQVTFTQTGGVNAAAFVCNPASCQSDANGIVTATYTGTNPGADTIKACFTNGTGTHCTGVATINWIRACDVNLDGVINSADINAIMAARGTVLPAGTVDARDPNGDLLINTIDARYCSLRCTNAGCN